MKAEQNQVIVESKFLWGRLLIPILLLVGLAVTAYVVRNFPQVEQRAIVIYPSSTPLMSLAPSPLDLATPYIRLHTNKDKYPYQASVPVEIFLNTGDMEISEAHISLSYDPHFFSLAPNDIKVLDVFTSFGLENLAEGKLDMTLFVPPQQDYLPVKTDTETKIAIINFKTGSESTDKAEIRLIFSKKSIEGTSLIEAGKERGVQLQNALENVSGVSFEISP